MLHEFDEFEWDTTKAKSNFKKHKITFLQATAVFADMFALVEYDDSEEYGEERFLMTGIARGKIIVVVPVNPVTP